MGIFYIPPSVSYLEAIADYLIATNQNNINKQNLTGYNFVNYEIYLPTYKACRYLQEIIITKVKSAVVLPLIKTFNSQDLSIQNSSSQDLSEQNNLLRNNFGHTVTMLEQELMLAKIIHVYPKFRYSIIQALNLSRNLKELFREFTLNDLDLTKLHDIYSGDYAEHWLDIQEFLIYSKNAWQSYLEQNSKIDPATAYLRVVEDKINNLKRYDKQIIIAGFVPDNILLQRLYKSAINSSNVKLILPSLPFELVSNFWNVVADHSNLKFLKNLLDYCKITLDTISPLPGTKQFDQIEQRLHSKDIAKADARSKCLFNIFFSTKNSIRLLVEGINDIKYIPVVNQIEEAALIAVIIKYYNDYAPNSRIAIVTENHNLIKKIEIFLKRFDLTLDRNGPQSLADSPAAGFLMSLFDMIESDFKSPKTLSFMKHAYFCSDEVYLLEKTILRQAPCDNLMSLLAILRQQDDKLLFWFECFVEKLQPLIDLTKIQKVDFKQILITLIEVAENICDNLWQQSESVLVEFLGDLVDKADIITDIHIKDFSMILQILLSNNRSEISANWQPKLFVVAPNELALANQADYLILADLNDNSWPKTPIIDPWISDRMRGALGLEKKSARIVNDLQYFFNAMHGKNVILTRALKIAGTETLASRFLLKLLSRLETQGLLKYLEPDIDWLSVVKEILLPHKLPIAQLTSYHSKQEHFPKKIAVTYIELLMRNPHGFYAKKILKFDKLPQIMFEAGAREFGLFIHDVFENYMQNYEQLASDKLIAICHIAQEIMRKNRISQLTEIIWWPRFKNIAAEFIFYDQSQRKLGEIYTEIQGSAVIKINDCEIMLTAKADRIEVMYDGNVNIIDFKTGIVPTHKDIEVGLSPQLLIEYLILINGGFSEIKKCREVTLTYIKLASSKPYLRKSTVKMKIDIKDFTEEGVKKLLTFFTQKTVNYLACPNKNYAPIYNDYKHLARIE